MNLLVSYLDQLRRHGRSRHFMTVVTLIILISFGLSSPLYGHVQRFDSPLSGQENEENKINTQLSSGEKIRYERKASTRSQKLSDDPDYDDGWLESTEANLDGDSEEEEIFQTPEEEILSFIRSELESTEIMIVPGLKKTKSSGRQTFEYTFAVHGIPIRHHHIRAIVKVNKDLSILGSVPKARYDKDLFASVINTKELFSSEELVSMIVDDLAKEHSSVDDSKLNILSQNQCVVTSDEKLLPAICLSVQYQGLWFYETIYSVEGELLSWHVIGQHYCGLLRDVYRKNLQSGTQDFSIKLCDQPSEQRDRLADDRFMFMVPGLANQLKTSCFDEEGLISYLLQFAAKQTQNSLTMGVVGRGLGFVRNLWNPYLVRSAEPPVEFPDEREELSERDQAYASAHLSVNKRPGEFAYNPGDEFAKRKIHVYSYLSRMMDWFESLNFEPYDLPIIINISPYPCDSTPSNASYAFYKREDNDFRAHILSFGMSGAHCPELCRKDPKCPNSYINEKPSHPARYNIATDFDIAAHELAHYVVASNIHGVPESEYSERNHTDAIHEGLADYFTFAATGEDCLGETVSTLEGYQSEERQCLRTARPQFKYKDHQYNAYVNRHISPDIHTIGQLVSGFLWRARTPLDSNAKRRFDQMVLESISFTPKFYVTFEDLIQAIKAADEELTQGAFCDSVRDSLIEYDFLTADGYTMNCGDSPPLPANSDNSIISYNITDHRALQCREVGVDQEIAKLTGEDVSLLFKDKDTELAEDKKKGQSYGCQDMYVGLPQAYAAHGAIKPASWSTRMLSWLWLVITMVPIFLVMLVRRIV
ncbi:MAG: hypothetical protein OXC40_02145 [Proteobacteria bacterium]|nr:hypothetical protein [Pseudomonadota bacterium]